MQKGSSETYLSHKIQVTPRQLTDKSMILSSGPNIVERGNDQSSDQQLKIMDTYTDEVQISFRQKLEKMQVDIERTSRLLEYHKKRQGEAAGRWQAS